MIRTSSFFQLTVARLTAQGLRSRETRIPVYVAVSEEDDDGLPTAKSIPKLVHLLDATSHRNKDTAQYEEVQPHVGVDHQSYRDKAPIESGIPVIELNSDNQASNPNVYQTPTISDKRPSTSLSVPSSPSSSNDDPTIAVAVASPVATSAESSVPSTSSQKEPTDNAAAKAELEVISKIHHLIEKQQETLFKQHVESVIKDHLVNLVKQQVNQALAQTSAGRGNQEASNRQTHYVDHITAANSQRHQPSTQLGKISVGEKANLHQHNAMYRPTESAESAESVDKVTAQMIHQIKGQLDQLNSQLNQTVAALPAPAPTPAPHKTPSPSALQLTPEVIKEAVIAAAKEAERRMWAEEQVRRMTEHLADGDLHAVEQRNLIHNIMHHFRRPRDIDDRSMEVHAHEEEETSLPNPSELYEYHREESSPNVPETISIPVVLLPQREADDVISHDRYHHEGDADAGHQQSNDEEDQDKKKKK